MLNLSNTVILNNKSYRTDSSIVNSTPTIEHRPTHSERWANSYNFTDFYRINSNGESICENASPEQLEQVFQTAKNLTFENFLLNGNTNDSFTKDYYKNGFFFFLDSNSAPAISFAAAVESAKASIQTERRYRYSRYPVVSHPEYSPQNLLYRLPENFHKWKDQNGNYHVSVFPKEFISYFRKKVSLDSQSLTFFKTSQLETTYKFFKFNPNSRSHKVSTVLVNEFDVSNDSLSPFLSLSKIQNLELPNKISFIEFENCSRGSKPVTHSFATRTCGRNNPNKYSMFVYSHKVPCCYLENDTLVQTEATYYGLATFTSIQDFSKYKKFLAYYAEMFQMIRENEASWLLNPERFKKILQERYSKYMKYWKTIPSWLSSVSQNEFQEIHTNRQYTSYSSSLTKASISALGSLSVFTNSKYYRQYNSINKKHSEAKRKLEDANSTIQHYDRNKRNYLSSIEHNERQIKQYQEYIENSKKELSKLDQSVEESKMIVEQYVPLIASLETSKEKAQQKYETEIQSSLENIDENSSSFKFIQNLKNSGIQIDSIKYRKEDNTVIDLNQNPSLLIQAKKSSVADNQDVVLHSIDFRILKPVIIKVDYGEKGNSCKKVVGGPYVVKLTGRDIHIGLLTSNSVHGHSSGQLWVHPHTPSFRLNGLNSITNHMVRGCLGEASVPIWSAFKSADPKMAIYAAMTWITSANSSDAWGKYWRNFPPVQNVEFDLDDTDAMIEKKLFKKNLQSTDLIIENFIPENVVPSNLTTDQNITSFIENTIEQELNPPQTQQTNQVDPYQDFTQYVPFGSTSTN